MNKAKLAAEKFDTNRYDTDDHKNSSSVEHNFFGDRAVLSLASGIYIVQFSEIIHIEGDGGYSTFFLQDGRKMVVSKTLITIERHLSNIFTRVHQSHIINLFHLKHLSKKEGYVLTMSDNSKIAISTRRREAFLKQLENFNQF